MPRKPRVHQAGAIYHVILRGNAKQDIFSDVEDRRRFLTFIQEGIARFGHRVHGYCLMTNHVHLALQVGDIPLSRVMQNLSLRYTKWVNWRQDRIGHVFHGRFKAVMVEADSYLTQLVAYLHLNPMRARMVKSAEEYAWSSHRAYLGLDQAPWVTTAFVLSQFSNREKAARNAFHAYVTSRADEGHRPEFHGEGGRDSRLLGEDSFIDEVLAKESAAVPNVPIEDLLAAVQEVCEVTAGDMAGRRQGVKISEARALAAWGVHHFATVTITDLARIFRRDVSTLSSAIRRLENRARSEAGVAARMEVIRSLAGKFASFQT